MGRGGAVFVIAALEGSGHHFFDAVGPDLRRLAKQPPMSAPLTLCMERTFYASAPMDPPLGCPPPLESGGGDWLGAAYFGFCSYPCGSLTKSYHELASPDVSLLHDDIHPVHPLKVVVLIRHPLHAVLSAWHRRHSTEMSIPALVHQASLAALHLDTQLSQLPPSTWRIFHYEDLVTSNTSVAALADFLEHPLPRLHAALSPHQRAPRPPKVEHLANAEGVNNASAFVEYAFLHPRARYRLPRLYAAFQRYRGVGFGPPASEQARFDARRVRRRKQREVLHAKQNRQIDERSRAEQSAAS